MIIKSDGIILLIFILGISLLLSGCASNPSTPDEVYEFSGAKGAGDFIDVTINLSDNTYAYDIREGQYKGESGSGSFQLIGTSGIGPYEINGSDDRFVMLDDEVLLISDNEAVEGNQLITALKRSSVNYADEIDEGNISGDYHIATSLEGNVGLVTIPAEGSADSISIALEDQPLLTLPFSYQEDYKSLRLLETEEIDDFRHYGVFTSDYKIGVFDSYIDEGSNGSWEGDGMAILVKKDTYNISDYKGIYSYMDVDGSESYMTFEIREEGTECNLYVEGGEEPLVDLKGEDVSEDPNDNRIDFSADLIDDSEVPSPQSWTVLLLPEKMMIIASNSTGTFGTEDGNEGGLGIGVKID